VKYLVLSADYLEPSLTDARGPGFGLDDVVSDPDLRRAIHEWNRTYQDVIPMDQHQRAQVIDRIDALDREGLTLCERIVAECSARGETVKVQYFREGLLQTLP
jgi:hypothetical protein